MLAAALLLPLDAVLHPLEVAAGFLLLVATAVPLALAERPQPPRGAAAAGILSLLAAVVLLRAGTAMGGGYAPLVLLPVVWAALHGRRRAAWLGVAGAAVVVIVPLLVAQGAHYPAASWRAGLLFLVVNAVVAARVTSLVDGLRRSKRRATAIVATMSDGFAVTSNARIVSVNDALCAMTGFTRDELLGATPPYPFWPPELHEESEELRRSVVAADGGQFELMLMRADGGRFLAAVTATATELPGVERAFLNTVRDITAQRAHEEAILRRADDLVAIAEVTRVVGHSDPHDARQTICQMAQGIATASAASIWELDEDGVLHNTCVLGAPAPNFVLGDDARDLGAHVAVRTGQPLFIADTASSARCDQRLVELFGSASAYFQPIPGPRSPRGVLITSWAEPVEAPSTDTALLLEVLAAEAATALERAELLDRLQRLSITDQLTGLPNRRAWDDILGREVASARRLGRSLSVVMIDLDHFKAYNDRHGHLAGDRLLRTAASVWSEELRATDVLARWGGEEFALLLPGCDAASAEALVDRLGGRLPDRITFSAGIACLSDTTDPAGLVADADRALYAAKAAGRNRVHLAVRP